MQVFKTRTVSAKEKLVEATNEPSTKDGCERPRRSSKKWLIAEAVKMSCLYFALSPLIAMPLYNHMAFFPTTQNLDASGPIGQLEKLFHVEKKDVYFKSANGSKLHGWLFRNPRAKRVIIFSHGNGGNIAHRLPNLLSLLKADTSVLLYDYEGYGLSEGSPDIVRIREDGVAAYDYLVNDEHYSPNDIVLFGESIGTGVSSYISSQRKVAGIILQSGYTSLITAGKDHLPWLHLYPNSFFPPDLDCVAVMKKPHAPLLLLHGDEDSVLPSRYSQEVFKEAVAPKQLIIVKGTGHNNLALPDQKAYMDGYLQFMKSLPN